MLKPRLAISNAYSMYLQDSTRADKNKTSTYDKTPCLRIGPLMDSVERHYLNQTAIEAFTPANNAKLYYIYMETNIHNRSKGMMHRR